MMDSTPSPSLLSRRSSGSSSPRSLTLDLSAIPALTQPTPPSNTLIFTNLQDLDIFRADNLQTIRELIEKTCHVHTWSPLRSFRRIIVSFLDEQSAIGVRQAWDGETIMDHRVRVYFGQHTPVEARDEHLALPDAGKLFFISPPPSPLTAGRCASRMRPTSSCMPRILPTPSPSFTTGPTPPPLTRSLPSPRRQRRGLPMRSRSSTLIYHPEDHSSNSDLPAIAVEDMTDEPMSFSYSPIEAPRPAVVTHTARPPVELMQGA
ncbi:unnamed protein product [Parascedosporium putredinis]|uniref:Calcipressin n=1 Tax=Parascedosporium putredinis TaxID=1442378 RepID=A0A9P1ME21_9PEZI|nr:unnamed protein product [Parascedosporium putredinis]CAI7999643.1 unnamed protein product [Parascedosporium putredinis]